MQQTVGRIDCKLNTKTLQHIYEKKMASIPTERFVFTLQTEHILMEQCNYLKVLCSAAYDERHI